ncbi:host specificity protein J, partial [Klebsiella variicola]|uniref:host specificity protein J n=1 Tax=Klebsiella variicola TaxID=244366 RepID=UPI0018C7BA65
MAEIKGIAGAKNNGGSKDNGQNRGTEIASVAYMKILLALSEGQIAGQFTGQDISLDGTPLLDADGHENFPGVTWEWRSGLVDQDYIQGFPAVENEISVSTEIKSGTPWVKAINNTQLSAVRLRIKFPNGVYSLRDSGGKDGYRIEFAIDVSTDGSTYTEYGRDTVDGIANTGYERSYRIDLPRANSGWQIRVRRLTENKNNNKTADVSRIESITEIVDAKLRYPNTALLFVQFDSTLFDGRTPTVTVKAKGLVIRVPSNYDPVERTYSGSWDGTFKWAWSNNPAWIFYDLVLNKRYGLGKRISSDQVDKWTLYQIGQYCDAPVSDGAGGKEARYLCDLYISQRTDAWTVLMDLANIFRGMISWSNNLLSVDADMPREMDPDFVFNKSNIVGSFTFSSTSERTNYSAAIVTYSNPQNNYQDDQASVYSQEVADRFGFNTIELSRIGCTRESEAQRHGAYAIETNRDDNGVEFKTGMEGRIPRVGKVIGINNAPMAGRQNGGRVAAVSGKRITLDRAVAAKAGDTLIINLPDGKSQGRKVQGVQDRIVTVEQEYNPAPQAEAGWILDQSDLAIQQFRVKRVVNNNDGTVTINGLPYNPNKFPRVDDGAVIEDRPVTVVPPRGQEAPDDITISSLYRVSQGIGITTLVATWSPVKNAIAYEMQWRQNNGDWINLPRTGNTRFEVDGIYTGRYVVRVRAINAQDIASVWGISKETELTGKSGAPLPPLALATRSLVHGVQVSWEFPTGSEDTLRTELQYSKNQDGSAPMLLSDVAYPGKSYQQMGLSMGAEFWYRARLVDRLGNESPWTGWVQGMASDNFDDYYENLT